MPVEREYGLVTDFEEQKEHLRKVLDREDISPLAREITVETLRDWVAIEVANSHFYVPEFKRTSSTLDLPIPKYGGELEAGQEHLLVHQFGHLPKGEELAEAGELGHIAFSFDPKQIRIEILPTIFRHVLLDIHGRSKPARFLMMIPVDQRGRSGYLNIDVIVGSQWIQSESYNYKVI